MRDVAVTEGDKVEAELRLGVSVNTYGVNDLVAAVDAVEDAAAIDRLVAEYADSYRLAPELVHGASRHESLRYGARVEAGPAHVPGRRWIRRVHHELRGSRRAAAAAGAGGAAVDGRRLRLRRRGRLEDLGDGGRGEGDRRTIRPWNVLYGGLHLPLWTGRAEDPRGAHARGLSEHRRRAAVVRDPPALDRRTGRIRSGWCSTRRPGRPWSSASSDSATGSAWCSTRSRSYRRTSRCELPVARAVWKPAPDLSTSAESWLTAGGPHHTVLTRRRRPKTLVDFAHMLHTELLVIDQETTTTTFTDRLRWNQVYYRLAQGLPGGGA